MTIAHFVQKLHALKETLVFSHSHPNIISSGVNVFNLRR